MYMQYVREAKVAHPSGKAPQEGNANDQSEASSISESILQQADIPGGDDAIESDVWVEPSESIEEAETPPLPPRPTPSADRSLSERIAMVSVYIDISFQLNLLKQLCRTM